MKPKDVAEIRKRLKLSAREMGLALGLRGDPGRTVRRYESGEVEITGPVQTALLALAEGFRPPWWPKGVEK